LAATFDTANGNSGYPPSGISFSHTLNFGSGNDRVVLVGITLVGGVSTSISSCTYNSQAMTLLGSVSETYFGRETWTYVYILYDAGLPSSSGSYTVSVTATGTTVPYSGIVEALGFYGAAQTTPNYATNSGFSNPAYDTVPYSTNITVGTNSGLLVDFGGAESNNSASAQAPGSGQTERQDIFYGNNCLLAASTKPYTSSGSNSMQQTPNGEYWAFVHVAVELADGDGGIIVVDSDSDLENATVMNHTFPVTAGDNRMLLVGAGGERLGGGNVNSVTYNGTALQKVENKEYDEGANNASWWYLLDANFPGTPGSYNIQVTYSGAYAPGFLAAVEVHNAKQAAPEEENGSSATSTNTLNTTITTLTDGAAIFGYMTTGDTGTFTPQSGQTELEEQSGGAGGASMVMGYEIIPTAGATNMQWLASSTRNRLVQMVIAVAPFSEEVGLNVVMMGCNF